MKALTGVLVLVVLACPSAHAENLFGQVPSANQVQAVKQTELEKTLKVAEYYQKTGKVAAAQFYRAKAEKMGGMRIYVKVQLSDRLQALHMQEVIIKSITKETPHRVVGSVDHADLIL